MQGLRRDKMNAETENVLVQCRFVRGRNALLCSGDFGPMFTDLYLHLGQTGVVLGGGADEKLKLLLAALVLHAAAQPRASSFAWTMHFEGEGLNLFAAVDGPTGRVTGQAFSENVRRVGSNILHGETVRESFPRRKSSVEFRGGVFAAAEAYYECSEQRPARFFELGGDDFAILAAQPDCDTSWFREADVGEISPLARQDNAAPLETRAYRFECGCSPERVASAIFPALRGSLDEVFAGDSHINVPCPRCGRRHELPRGLFDEGV
ncbi:MAG: disulfide bond chaperone [Chthoniobacterales bacterium]|nr:disulfide bond chaperone [Chthoniobacterales bacterium]